MPNERLELPQPQKQLLFRRLRNKIGQGKVAPRLSQAALLSVYIDLVSTVRSRLESGLRVIRSSSRYERREVREIEWVETVFSGCSSNKVSYVRVSI